MYSTGYAFLHPSCAIACGPASCVSQAPARPAWPVRVARPWACAPACACGGQWACGTGCGLAWARLALLHPHRGRVAATRSGRMATAGTRSATGDQPPCARDAAERTTRAWTPRAATTGVGRPSDHSRGRAIQARQLVGAGAGPESRLFQQCDGLAARGGDPGHASPAKSCWAAFGFVVRVQRARGANPGVGGALAAAGGAGPLPSPLGAGCVQTSRAPRITYRADRGLACGSAPLAGRLALA